MSSLKNVYQYLLQLTGDIAYLSEWNWPTEHYVKIPDDEADTVIVKLLLLDCIKEESGASYNIVDPCDNEKIALFVVSDKTGNTKYGMKEGLYVYQLSASFLDDEGLV